jgi:hypothetical protein
MRCFVVLLWCRGRSYCSALKVVEEADGGKKMMKGRRRCPEKCVDPVREERKVRGGL